MIKEGNVRINAVLTPQVAAKLQSIKDDYGLKDSGVVCLAIDYYYKLLNKERS